MVASDFQYSALPQPQRNTEYPLTRAPAWLLPKSTDAARATSWYRSASLAGHTAILRNVFGSLLPMVAHESQEASFCISPRVKVNTCNMQHMQLQRKTKAEALVVRVINVVE